MNSAGGGPASRIVVACFGNVLRGDDGFGNVVAARLLAAPTPAAVHVIEVGIGGIHLVQELLERADGLVVVDTVDLDRRPGTVVVMRPDVVDVDALTPSERRDELADMHYATPDRALMLARAMGALPDETFVVGCQPLDAERLGEGLSAPVAAAVEPAIDEIRRLVTEQFAVDWR